MALRLGAPNQTKTTQWKYSMLPSFCGGEGFIHFEIFSDIKCLHKYCLWCVAKEVSHSGRQRIMQEKNVDVT